MTAISIPDERWLREIKSVSLLGSVLAKQQAVDAQVDEVVQFRDGFLTEGLVHQYLGGIRRQAAGSAQNNLILEGIRCSLMGELAAEAGIPFESRRIGARKWKTRTSCCCPHARRRSAAHRRAGRQAGGFGQARPRL